MREGESRHTKTSEGERHTQCLKKKRRESRRAGERQTNKREKQIDKEEKEE